MKRLAADVAAGAAAGVAATVPMSAVMWAAQQGGLIGKQPPEEVTEAALHTVGAAPDEPNEDRLTLLNHLIFGAVAGGAFGAVRRRLPATGHDHSVAVVFGLAVWLTAYQGWVPALNIMPPASEDEPGRPQSMAVAHVVFGWTLGELWERLRR